MAKIGIVPGGGLRPEPIRPGGRRGDCEMPPAPAGPQDRAIARRAPARSRNGWLLNLKVGHYGTDYMARAWLSAFGIPANAPKDAVYVVGLKDADGQPLDASRNKYVVRFKSKKDLPPADGFWSLTMHDDQYFFHPQRAQPIHGQPAQQAEDQPRRLDRSLSAKGQAEPGQGIELVARTTRRLIPMFRLYWPKETSPSVLDGTWWPPAIQKVEAS